jgi:hypothetical protein
MGRDFGVASVAEDSSISSKSAEFSHFTQKIAQKPVFPPLCRVNRPDAVHTHFKTKNLPPESKLDTLGTHYQSKTGPNRDFQDAQNRRAHFMPNMPLPAPPSRKIFLAQFFDEMGQRTHLGT